MVERRCGRCIDYLVYEVGNHLFNVLIIYYGYHTLSPYFHYQHLVCKKRGDIVNKHVIKITVFSGVVRIADSSAKLCVRAGLLQYYVIFLYLGYVLDSSYLGYPCFILEWTMDRV